MRATCTLFLCLLAYCAAAQSAVVRGTITDASSGESLPGVTVKSNTRGASSDIDGNYTLQLNPGTHQITFTFIGYTSKTITVKLEDGEEKELNVTLGSADNLLQQTTVTAGKFEKPLGEVTVSLEVIKPRLIESVNSTSVDEVLTKVPGLTILDGQASIRGGSGYSQGAGTRVLILLDDIPALQVDAGFPNWDDFPVENISQIEVLKGAASSLYGSAAMNGIINFRTGFAKDKPETDAAIFGKAYGSPKDKSKQWWGRDTSELQLPFETGFSFAHRRKEGKLDIVLGSYGLFRESYNRDTYRRYLRLTPNFKYQVNDRLSIGLNSNFTVGKNGSFFIWANDGEGAYQAGLGSTSFTAGRLRFTIDPTLQYFDKAGNRHKILSRYYYVHNDNSGNQSNDSRMYYGEYQFQRPTSFGLVLTAGVVGITTSVDAELYSNSTFSSQNAAGYLQLDQKLFDRLNISAGVRYEYNLQKSPELIDNIDGGLDTIPNGRTEEAKPVFRLGANYQLGRATFLRASWGQGYRYPTIAEKFITTQFGTGNVVEPNASLVSETGWTAELGIKQGLKIQKWQGFVDVTGFVSEYEDMMEFVLAAVRFVPDPGPPPTILVESAFQSQNVGDTRVEGVEMSIAGQGPALGGSLSLLAGYTYIDPKYQEFTERIDETSSVDYNVLKYRFKHMIKFDAEYKVRGFGLGVALRRNSHMEAIDAVFEVPSVESFAGVKNFRENNNNGFSILDIRSSYQITKAIKASFIVGNVLNEEYTLRPALLEAPRNFTLRLDWKLRS